MQDLRHVGLDVHAQSISAAVSDARSTLSLGVVEPFVESVVTLLKKVGPPERLVVVYEAGPTGYNLCRGLRSRGYRCDVIAPTLVPQMAGDRIKTDRRDALKLAQLSRAGMLTAVSVPEEKMEALRDLVRCREAAKADELRARHRVSKFLLRHGRQRPKDIKKSWTLKHMTWLAQQEFEETAQALTYRDLLQEVEHQIARVAHLAEKIQSVSESLPELPKAVVASLQAMRGIAKLTAVTILAEVGDLTRFSHPTQLMAYAGLVPREHSSGETVRRGAITKTGNAHLRRVMVESAWAYRFAPRASYELKQRQTGRSPRILALAWHAQERLNKRYRDLLSKGKHHNKVLGAVARELLGFVWHVGVEAEKEFKADRKAA